MAKTPLYCSFPRARVPSICSLVRTAGLGNISHPEGRPALETPTIPQAHGHLLK